MGLFRLKGSRATNYGTWRFGKIFCRSALCWCLRFELDNQQIFFKTPKLVLLLSETHSTSLERPKPLLLIQSLFKTLAAVLMYIISVQSDLILIVFIKQGCQYFLAPVYHSLQSFYDYLISKW